MNCLLCHSSNVEIKETHTKEDLLKVWSPVNIDISEELKIDQINVYQCKECALRFFDPKLAGGDKFYSELGKLEWYYLHPGKTEYDYIQKYINEGDKILDIGSGRGVLFTKIKKKVDYTGLELSTKAVALAKEDGINVKQEDLLLHADAHKSYYDVVCLFQVLEHLTELDSFIKSIYLTLKNNGLFVIAVPNNDGFISKTPNYTFNLPPHHTILWTEKSLRYLANKYNFEVVHIEREFLQEPHRENAYLSYISERVRRLYGVENKLIDYSKKWSKINSISWRLYKNKWFNKFGMPFVKKKQKYGQSIIVTLRKK